MKHWTDFTVQKIGKGEKGYPINLLHLKDMPKQIYYRGELNNSILKKSVAIVGSRRMTRYGASVIDKFVSCFVSQGVTTVSGYMYGVDSEVHNKTVEYGGKTIAVMGGGINSPYPSENDNLYTKILQNGGTVLSEYEPDAKPKLWMYPKRNRIIAALATLGVLVVEAGEKSGSLITVNYAKELKKKTFAIPGQITSSVSEGANYLIKTGIAKMVTDPREIIKVKEQGSERVKAETGLTGTEGEIYHLLANEEMTIDEIAIRINKGLVETSAMISLMALNGTISEAGGKYFVV